MRLQRRNYSWNKIPPLYQPVGQYAYLWSPARIASVFSRRLYRQLIDSLALKRLADIRFLGAIDYFIHPSGRQLNRRRHTRLEHTLGVGHLALLYSRLAELEDADEGLVVAAALLHDIGHPPLSHSIEPAFKKYFDIDHHAAGAQIISGNAPNRIGKEIAGLLSAEGIDPEHVISLIAGKCANTSHNFLFEHPINIDTLEAISRSETYFKAAPTSPTPDVIFTALFERQNLEKLDQFWMLKDQVYNLLIQGPLGVYADDTALHYVEKNIVEFSPEDFFLSERALRKRHPSLFACLEEARRNLMQDWAAANPMVELEMQTRRFLIDETAPPGSVERYKQVKMRTMIAFAGLKQLARQQIEIAAT